MQQQCFIMKKTGIWKYLFTLVMVFTFSACASKSNAANNDIDQQKAMDTGVEIASKSMPEIGGSQVTPSNIAAEKMTLVEAAKRLNSNPQETFSEGSPNTQVWLVSMNGVWLPAAVPGVVQKPFQHLYIVIDAKTGVEIFRNMQP